ncbi:hypothetical protein OG216_25525 [Streptomycetaceae bacterium NBC_01309]
MSGTPQGQHGQQGQQEFGGWADGTYPGQYAEGYAEGYADAPAEGGYAEAYSDGYAASPYGYEGYPQQAPTLPDAGQDPRQYDSGGFPQQYAPAYEQQQPYQAAPESYAGESYAAEAYAPYAPGGEQEAAYGYRAPAEFAPYPGQGGDDRRHDGFDGDFAGSGGVAVEFDAREDFGHVDVLDDFVPFDDRGDLDDLNDPNDLNDLDDADAFGDSLDALEEQGGHRRRGRGAAEPVAVPAPGRQAAERAARRVPIWHPPGLVPALLTSGLAGVLIAGAVVGGPAIVASVAVLQVVTAAGWFRLHGMWPARQGIALAILAGGAADVAVLLAGDDALGILPGILAAVLGVVLVQQLARRDGRPELLPALTVTASAALLTVLDVLFVLAARVESPDVRDGALVVVGAAAVAAAVIPAAMPLPGPLGAALGLAAAAVAGLVAGSVLNLGGTAVVLGVGAGLMGLLGRRTAGYDHPSKFVHFTAGVALPLALAAPAVYLLGRAALG